MDPSFEFLDKCVKLGGPVKVKKLERGHKTKEEKNTETLRGEGRRITCNIKLEGENYWGGKGYVTTE